MRIARHVGVLNPQNKRAARVPGVKPVKQRRAGAANVQETSRTRRKSNSYFHINRGAGRGVPQANRRIRCLLFRLHASEPANLRSNARLRHAAVLSSFI